MSIVRGEVTEIKFELEQSRQENGESIDRAARFVNRLRTLTRNPSRFVFLRSQVASQKH